MTSSITSIFKSLRLMPGITKEVPKPTQTFSTSVILISTAAVTTSSLPEITLAEVADHDDYRDCWIVIYDRVYNVTKFLLSHPGGEDVIMDHAGRDATLAFHGTGHSRDAIELMRDYVIGELPPHERIFRGVNAKVLSSGIPE